MNKVMLLGRLTADPDMRQTNAGDVVVKFTVAVNRFNGEADFINCVAWRKTAETVCNYFKRGNMIGVEGSLRMNKYKDKDGNNRTTYDVNVEHIDFASDRSNANNDANIVPDNTTPVVDEELPF